MLLQAQGCLRCRTFAGDVCRAAVCLFNTVGGDVCWSELRPSIVCFATQCLRTPAALPPQIACKADARCFGPVPCGRRFRFDASVGVLLMDESGREGLDLR